MTSPPFRYICKYCGKENWLMPEPLYFWCFKCGNKNKVHYFLRWWWTSKISDKLDEALQ